MTTPGEPSILQAAHAAVARSVSNLVGHVRNIEGKRSAEEVALCREHLAGLEKARAILKRLEPYEDDLREWLRERTKAQ